MQKKKNKIDIRKLIVGSVFLLAITVVIVFRDQIKSFAMPPAAITMINSLSVDLTSNADLADDAVWNTGRVNGLVSFDAHVTGRTGNIDYFFWPDCYNPALAATATYDQTVAACGAPLTYANNPGLVLSNTYTGITYDYPQAGIKYPRIIVARNGINSPLTSITIYLKPSMSFRAETLTTTDGDSENITWISQPGSTIQAYYHDSVRFVWTVKGIIDPSTLCEATQSASGSDITWTGTKNPTGTETLGEISGGTHTFTLTCHTSVDAWRDRSNTRTLTFIVSPAVSLKAELVQSPTTNITSTNGQTLAFNAGGAGIPINSKIKLTGSFFGPITTCSINSSQSSYIVPTNPFTFTTSGSQTTTIPVDQASDFTLSCSYTSGATTSTSWTKIQAIIAEGNCAFYGDNKIQALFFCKNSFSAMNGADNLDMKGSIVAKGFDITSSSYNVFFQYDQRLADKEPPGFRYLNIPRPKEVGN